MPTQEEHLWKASNNEQFIERLTSSAFKDTPYLDWTVTATFYAALHYVGSYLALKADFHPYDHKSLGRFMNKVGELRPIVRQYLKLKDASWNARYTCQKFKPEVVTTMINQDLRHIRDYIASVSLRDKAAQDK